MFGYRLRRSHLEQRVVVFYTYVLSNMSEDHRRNADQNPSWTQGGDPSGTVAVSAATFQSIQPKSHQLQAVHSGSSRNEIHHQPLPRSQSSVPKRQPAKIAIPRLPRDTDWSSSAGSSFLGDKHRVPHACVECRTRKTKCSGERPSCKHCLDFKILCSYPNARRDKMKMWVNGFLHSRASN